MNKSKNKKATEEVAAQTDDPKIVVRHERSARSVHFSGPLPPASELNAYEEALPGLAERIVAMAEKEQDARLQAERDVLLENKKMLDLAARGQWFVFVLVGASLLCGTICAFLKQPTASAAAFGVAFGLGYLVFNERSADKNENAE